MTYFRKETNRVASCAREFLSIFFEYYEGIGVKDARHLDRHIVLTAVIEKQSLSASFTFIVAGTDADRIDVTPIFLGLRMNIGVAVDLRCGRLQYLDLQPLGEPEHIDRADDARLRGLSRIVLVVHWRSWTGEVKDLVDLDIERKRHVMPHELHALVVEKMRDIMA